MKYIDIHCHLDFPDYDSDRGKVLARMREKEIGAITIGADLESSRKAVEIAEGKSCLPAGRENVWATIGTHPEDTNLFDEKEFEKLVVSPGVVGIGECGLDYSGLEWKEKINEQRDLFEKQIQFALKHNKPLMIHCRDARPTESFGRAYDDTLEVLKTYKKEAGEKLRGNVHFFAGNTSIAKEFLDLGFTMSFTGVITFARNYDEVVKYVPQDSVMSETDSPVMGAPAPYRGKRNEPTYVIEVVKKMAEIRGENADIFNEIIINNAKRVFGI